MKKATTIYVIDDDLIYQFAIKRIIKTDKVSHSIYSFADGEEAIEFINNNKGNKEVMPDIIFLDINMPIMDGWQFLEEYSQIKADLPKQPIIYLVSSSVDPVDYSRATQIEEVKNYLVKPLNTTLVKQIIAGNGVLT